LGKNIKKEVPHNLRVLLDRATEAFEKEKDSIRYISLAKLYISEAGREHTDNSMHLMGAYGYIVRNTLLRDF
jgi:alkylation response protein AidB-like acyl-CoA dehydrogenase